MVMKTTIIGAIATIEKGVGGEDNDDNDHDDGDDEWWSSSSSSSSSLWHFELYIVMYIYVTLNEALLFFHKQW